MAEQGVEDRDQGGAAGDDRPVGVGTGPGRREPVEDARHGRTGFRAPQAVHAPEEGVHGLLRLAVVPDPQQLVGRREELAPPLGTEGPPPLPEQRDGLARRVAGAVALAEQQVDGPVHDEERLLGEMYVRVPVDRTGGREQPLQYGPVLLPQQVVRLVLLGGRADPVPYLLHMPGGGFHGQPDTRVREHVGVPAGEVLAVRPRLVAGHLTFPGHTTAPYLVPHDQDPARHVR